MGGCLQVYRVSLRSIERNKKKLVLVLKRVTTKQGMVKDGQGKSVMS